MAVIKENLTLNVNAFNSICRTCLSPQDLHSINGIYDADLVSIEFILNKCTQVKVIVNIQVQGIFKISGA